MSIKLLSAFLFLLGCSIISCSNNKHPSDLAKDAVPPPPNKLSSATHIDTIYFRKKDYRSNGPARYVTDTIIVDSFDPQIIVGTAVLQATEGQMAALQNGIVLMHVRKTACQYTGEHSLETRISSITRTDTTITVDAMVEANCGHEFLCDMAVGDDGVIDLKYTGYGNYAACSCCFGLTFELRIDNFFRKGAPALKEVILNGDAKTGKRIPR